MILEKIFILAQAAGSGTSAANGANGAGAVFGSPIILMLSLVAIFYFMIIRPQNQKQQQQQAMLSALKTGDKVVTAGGMHGLIANVKESTVLVKVADNVKIEVDKSAISVVTKRTEDDAAPATAPAA
jgi:preprotein translocase subunit YajC